MSEDGNPKEKVEVVSEWRDQQINVAGRDIFTNVDEAPRNRGPTV